jgi:hypothetical protein
MNFKLTSFIFPIEKPILFSNHFKLYLDNPRTKEEIDHLTSLFVLSYESENNTLRLPIESDEPIFTLSRIVENFNRVFQEESKYIEQIVKSYRQEDIYEYIAKMFVIVRFEDMGEYQRLQEEKESEEEGTISLVILEDEHPIIKNSNNLKQFCSLLSLLINDEGKSYYGSSFLQEEAIENIQKYGIYEGLSSNIMMWSFVIHHAESHYKENKEIKEWDKGMWYFFPYFKEKLLQKSTKIDKFINANNEEKILYISKILHLTSNIHDEKIRLLNLVGLIELLLTHNPNFNRFNVEDSISKQFGLKTAIIVYLEHPDEDLEKLKKRLKIIYSQRSNVAHGNYTSIKKYVDNLPKKEGKEEYFDDLIIDSYWYLKAVINRYINDEKFVEFIKAN